MLRFKDNPKELMLALDRFLAEYYGDRQLNLKPGLSEISAEIKAWKISDIFKDFYSFAEKYPEILNVPNQDSFIFN